MTNPVPTRSEHLAWCKSRALEYADKGVMAKAFASMTSAWLLFIAATFGGLIIAAFVLQCPSCGG